MVDDVLYVAVHEGSEIIYCVTDTVVGDASLRIVVGAYLGRAVARRNHRLTSGGDVVDVFLVLLVIDEGAQTGKSTLLVLGLVARLRTFHKYLLVFVGHRVVPYISGTHTALHLVDVLSAGTARAECVPLDGTLVDFHIEGLCLRKHSNCCCGSMHTTLCLCGRNALHSMHAALVFQYAVDTFARNGEDDFLVASDSTFREARYSHLPALLLDILRIHAEEVAGKQSRFVAARTASYLHDDVLVVFRVGRNEQQFDFLFQLGDALLTCGEFLAQHLTCALVALFLDHLLGQSDIVKRVDVFLAGLDNLAQVLILLCQADVAFLVSNHAGVGDECAHLLIAAHEAFQFIEQSVIHSGMFLPPT